MSDDNSLPMHLLVAIAPLVVGEYTGSQLVAKTSAYAVDFDLDENLPYTEAGVTKRILLMENLKMFNANQQYTIIKDLIDESENLTKNSELKRLMDKVPDDITLEMITVKQSAARREIDNLLNRYPKVLLAWNNVYRHHRINDYRDALDNARLALELLIKTLLKNEKSLENQRRQLGQELSKHNVPNEFVNLLWDTINIYSKLQNNQVKHDMPVLIDTEVNYVLNQTYNVMKYLIEKIGDKNHDSKFS